MSLSLVLGILLLGFGCTKDDLRTNNAPLAKGGDKGLGQGLAQNEKVLVQHVTGTLNKKNDSGDAVPFEADLNIREFVVEGDKIFAVAVLSNITGSGLPNGYNALTGKTIKVPVNDYIAVPQGVSMMGLGAIFQDPTCPILNLVLGPLDLNLLGLTVHLDQVVLVIGAEPGQGALLGNLLCAVAGLLDGGPLGELADLLNQIVDIIGQILNL